MSLRIKETGGGTFTPAPEGTHVAVCVQIIDLGTQFSKYYQKSSPKVLIGWELPEERDSEDKPMLVWKRYTASLYKKSLLCQHLQAWRGREFTAEELEGFELTNIAGKACMVAITHSESDGKKYANVQSVMKLPKNMKAPAPESPVITFDIDDPDWEVFETFSESLKATIMESEEMKARNTRATSGGESGFSEEDTVVDDDEIPF